jgi:hypothetical protein
VIGVILLALNQAGTVYSNKNLPQPKRPLNMQTLASAAPRESAPKDDNSYCVWHGTEGNPEGLPPGKYLVDDHGRIRWLIDPGINGKLTHRDDGTEVKKFSPPQAELFALITHGILNQKLPWVLVLLGVILAVVMELSGVSSLPFAVGVYLPLSSTTPIFVGGLVRCLVERFGRKPADRGRKGDSPRLCAAPSGQTGTVPLSPAASELESEMSPGVLLSTGYIAGGTIAGVLIAFSNFSDKLTSAMAALGQGVPHQTATALITFVLLAVFLGFVGRGWLLEERY